MQPAHAPPTQPCKGMATTWAQVLWASAVVVIIFLMTSVCLMGFARCMTHCCCATPVPDPAPAPRKLKPFRPVPFYTSNAILVEQPCGQLVCGV